MCLRRAVFFTGAILVAVCAAAQDSRPESSAAGVAAQSLYTSDLGAPTAIAAPDRHRPAALTPLYAGYAGLNVADMDSTRRALGNGNARENNPAAGALGGGLVMMSAKAAVTAAVIVAGEKMRKKHPKAAVGFVAALDAVMAVVVLHNYDVARGR
jgi:hypothetical protein